MLCDMIFSICIPFGVFLYHTDFSPFFLILCNHSTDHRPSLWRALTRRTLPPQSARIRFAALTRSFVARAPPPAVVVGATCEQRCGRCRVRCVGTDAVGGRGETDAAAAAADVGTDDDNSIIG